MRSHDNHDLFFNLVSDPQSTVEQIAAFLTTNKVDLNHPRNRKMRFIEVAAAWGNPSVVTYLIETCQVNVASGCDNMNLLELSATNPKVLEYLLNPVRKIWEKFNDNTSDLHIYALTGRTDCVASILHENPLRILEVSNHNKNVFYWALLGNQQEVLNLINSFGSEFINRNIIYGNILAVRQYFTALKGYAKFLDNDFDLMVEAFALKVENYAGRDVKCIKFKIPQLEVEKKQRTPVVEGLNRCLADLYAFVGEMALEEFCGADSESEQKKSFNLITKNYYNALQIINELRYTTATDSARKNLYLSQLAQAHEVYAWRLLEDIQDKEIERNHIPMNEILCDYSAVKRYFEASLNYIHKIKISFFNIHETEVLNTRIANIKEQIIKIEVIIDKARSPLFYDDDLSDFDENASTDEEDNNFTLTKNDNHIDEERATKRLRRT